MDFETADGALTSADDAKDFCTELKDYQGRLVKTDINDDSEIISYVSNSEGIWGYLNVLKENCKFNLTEAEKIYNNVGKD